MYLFSLEQSMHLEVLSLFYRRRHNNQSLLENEAGVTRQKTNKLSVLWNGDDDTRNGGDDTRNGGENTSSSQHRGGERSFCCFWGEHCKKTQIEMVIYVQFANADFMKNMFFTYSKKYI